MSRSGYSDDVDGWELIRWRGAVASAIRGKRGQEFLRKLLAALDAMPHKRLIAEDLEKDGEVCAIGSVGRMEGSDMSDLDPFDYEAIGAKFGIPRALVQEIEFVNDEGNGWRHETPEERYTTVRKWVIGQIVSRGTPESESK